MKVSERSPVRTTTKDAPAGRPSAEGAAAGRSAKSNATHCSEPLASGYLRISARTMPAPREEKVTRRSAFSRVSVVSGTDSSSGTATGSAAGDGSLAAGSAPSGASASAAASAGAASSGLAGISGASTDWTGAGRSLGGKNLETTLRSIVG